MKSLLRRFVVFVSLAAALAGCSGGFAVARLDNGVPAAGVPLAWFSPALDGDRAALANWRVSVGPPYVRTAERSAAGGPANRFTLVSWNIALGAGDVTRLVGELRQRPDALPIVMLLQEAYRRGPAVPQLPRGARFAARLGGTSGRGGATDVESLGAALGMFVYYVPSMRNGGGESDEDRGNAILSDLPLQDLTAIELPFERQRRVAVAATVAGRTASGEPWQLRLVNVHLDNAMPRRGFLGSEYGRARQARGLVAHLDARVPTVLGGDFNTWFGFSDQVFLETRRAFPQTTVVDRGATFMGLLRLDHVFYRLPAGWRADVRRAAHRYGSDHTPIISTFDSNLP